MAAAVLAISAATGSVANASIVMTSYTETATSFEAVYAFTPNISPLDGVSNLGDSWETLVNQTYQPAVPLISPETWTFEWQGAHIATQHTGELPLLLTALGACSIGSGLTGTFCDTTTQVPHLAGHHYDEYRFWLELTDSSGYAFFSGTHVSEVPVPAAAWLFGSGLVGIVTLGRRNRPAVRG
jgi:hypothetical protein